jgi:hypothetical protein
MFITPPFLTPGVCLLVLTSPTRRNRNSRTRACVDDDVAAIVPSESRRNIIASASLLCSSVDYSARILNATADDVKYSRLSTSPVIIASYICKNCNSDFLSSVIRSKYRFLYRGLSPDESEAVTSTSNDLAAIIINDEPFDLLDSRTYNSMDSVTYFESLEYEMNAMEIPLKPSSCWQLSSLSHQTR